MKTWPIAALILASELGVSPSAFAESPPPPSPWFHMDDARPTPPPPPDMPVVGVRRKRRTGILAGGIVLLTVPYAFSVTGAVGNGLLKGPDRYGWLALPGAGPLILMAETTSPAGNVVLAGDALAQAAGIGLIAYDVLHPRRVDVADDTAEAPRVTLTPILAAGRAGVGVAGTF